MGMKYHNDFDSILGNDQIKEHLNKAYEKGKVSHSYILSGEEGLGKNLFARAFARLLLCEGDHTSSCSCHACKQLLNYLIFVALHCCRRFAQNLTARNR